MKAIKAQISFYEAFFKVHQTKGFRLTYPIPLPTSVAGMFGAMLGVERAELAKEFKGHVFGGSLVKHDGLIIENETFIQYKTTQVQKGVVRTQLVNNPTYIIAAAGPTESIEAFYASLKNHNMVYLPYGGQNDFFLKDVQIKQPVDVVQGNVVSNYAPQDLVDRIESNEAVLSILPVMQTESDNPNFYFLLKGQLKLKKDVNVLPDTKMALYPLEMFRFVQG